MVKTVLDYEPAGSVGAVNATPGTADQVYVVKVRVVDPSGADAEAEVRIALQEVNEPPVFNEDSDKRTTVYVAENVDDSNNTNVFLASANAALSVAASPTYDPTTDSGAAVIYGATDDDNFGDATADTDAAADADEGEVLDSTTNVVYFLEGGDADKFTLASATGGVALSKVATEVADYEGSYSIRVIARTTRGTGDAAVHMYDSVDVTVEVVDTDDNGTVSFSEREPQVGSSVIASVDDDDGDVTNVAWQWYRMTFRLMPPPPPPPKTKLPSRCPRHRWDRRLS